MVANGKKPAQEGCGYLYHLNIFPPKASSRVISHFTPRNKRAININAAGKEMETQDRKLPHTCEPQLGLEP